jgi:hypothetical protein
VSHENITNQLCKAVLESAAHDIVSIAEVRQMANDLSGEVASFSSLIKCVLLRLLESGVEVGHALNKTGQYVEFVGWQGSPDQKTERALALIRNDSTEADFSVWFALRSNVERYED